jgi:hypothetical protein
MGSLAKKRRKKEEKIKIARLPFGGPSPGELLVLPFPHSRKVDGERHCEITRFFLFLTFMIIPRGSFTNRVLHTGGHSSPFRAISLSGHLQREELSTTTLDARSQDSARSSIITTPIERKTCGKQFCLGGVCTSIERKEREELGARARYRVCRARARSCDADVTTTWH